MSHANRTPIPRRAPRAEERLLDDDTETSRGAVTPAQERAAGRVAAAHALRTQTPHATLTETLRILGLKPTPNPPTWQPTNPYRRRR